MPTGGTLIAEGLGQPEGRGKRFGAAHRGNAGLFPGAENQPQNESLGHKIKTQTGKNLIDAAFCFQETGNDGPEGAADQTGGE